MKTRFFFILILLTGIVFLINTCSKDEDDISYEEAIQLEALDDVEVEFWDNQENVELNDDEVLLPNGLTVKEFFLLVDPEFSYDNGKKSSVLPYGLSSVDFKNWLIGKIYKTAQYFTDDSNFRSEEDNNGPGQYGLAYSWGQKDHTIRATPPGKVKPPNEPCTELIYGLDCSGLLYRLFLGSDINLMNEDNETYANYQRKPSVLENAIKKKYPDYNIKVEDLGKIDPSEFESGDIIYWLTKNEDGIWVAKHIGIVLKKNDSGELAVAQSNGTSKVSGDCLANYGQDRGPCYKTLTFATSSNGLGSNYGIVRISNEAPDPPDLNRISVMVQVYGYYHETTPESSRDYESDNGSIQCYSDYTGKFTENVFKATYSGTSLNVNISGTIEANFNYNYDTINTLRWTETRQGSAWQNFKPFTQTRSCLVTKIPLAWGGIAPVFEVEGGETCDHILLLDNKLTSSELNYTLTNHECTWASKVYISMHKE